MVLHKRDISVLGRPARATVLRLSSPEIVIDNFNCRRGPSWGDQESPMCRERMQNALMHRVDQ
jgi:hypothetical protein